MIETGQKNASRGFIKKLANRLDVHPTSITPFAYVDEDFSSKKLSPVEKSLLEVGTSLQSYLVNSKAKKLRQYV